MSEHGISSIAKDDSSGGVEDIHVLGGARISESHPNFVGLLPFKPRSP
jgi:hypothetical protein